MVACLIFAKSIKDLVSSLMKQEALSETISDGYPKSAIHKLNAFKTSSEFIGFQRLPL